MEGWSIGDATTTTTDRGSHSRREGNQGRSSNQAKTQCEQQRKVRCCNYCCYVVWNVILAARTTQQQQQQQNDGGDVVSCRTTERSERTVSSSIIQHNKTLKCCGTVGAEEEEEGEEEMLIFCFDSKTQRDTHMTLIFSVTYISPPPPPSCFVQYVLWFLTFVTFSRLITAHFTCTLCR